MSDPHIESTTVLSDIIFVCVYMNVCVRVRECVCTTLCVCVCARLQKTLIELYTDVLNLLTEFDAKLNRKDGKFVNTLPQVQSTAVFMHTCICTCIHCCLHT